MPPSPLIGISNEYGASDDVPPENFMNNFEDTTSPPAFKGYRGKYGMIKTNIMTGYSMIGVLLGGPASPDGILFLTSAEPIADAWIAWAKTDPRYLKLVQVLFGGAFMTLVLAHAPLAAGLMANHGVKLPSLLNPLSMPMFKGTSLGSAVSAAAGVAPQPASDSSTPPEVDPFTANYRPVGAHAPTEDPGPPPAYIEDGVLRTYPDEGIPSDVDVQLREIARQTGKPYAELATMYLQEVAQDRIAQNGKLNTPATLGMPVQKPGA